MQFRPVTLMQPSPDSISHGSTKGSDCVATQRFICDTGGHGIRRTLSQIKQMIDAHDHLCPELRSNCELVLAEVCNNIEEHSYWGRTGCQFSIAVTVGPQTIAVETQDTGLPMPGLKLPEPRLPPYQVEQADLPEGGFGWYLIHVLAPNPTYVRHGETNHLRFVLTSQAIPTDATT